MTTHQPTPPATATAPTPDKSALYILLSINALLAIVAAVAFSFISAFATFAVQDRLIFECAGTGAIAQVVPADAIEKLKPILLDISDPPSRGWAGRIATIALFGTLATAAASIILIRRRR